MYIILLSTSAPQAYLLIVGTLSLYLTHRIGPSAYRTKKLSQIFPVRPHRKVLKGAAKGHAKDLAQENTKYEYD